MSIDTDTLTGPDSVTDPATDTIAPPTRTEPHSADTGPGPVSRGRLSRLAGNLTVPRRRAPTADGEGGGSVPPGRGRVRRPRLPDPVVRQPAPRDGRWWAGAALLTVSLLLLGFVVHAALLSGFQHHRAQAIAYDTLRTSLAKAETPIGQLDLNEDLVIPGTPVALLDAPDIGLSEVVVEGTDAQTLRGGIGHRRDSVMPGQAGTAVILGRQLSYGGPFAQLHRLQPGTELTITTGQGEHTYRVFGLRRAGDPMPEPLRAGEGRLELQTADGLALFPSGVLYVDAELVSDPQQSAARVLAYKALPPTEQAMGHDSGRWFIAFFVLAFFVAACIGTWWLWTTWGRWHAWLIGLPVLVYLGVATADQVMNALPNLI